MTNLCVTFDMDGTLVETQSDYNFARKAFGRWVVNKFNPDLSVEEVMDVQSQYSSDLYPFYGTHRKRFALACREAILDVVDEDIGEEELHIAENIGGMAIGSKKYYENKELFEGVEAAINVAQKSASAVNLLTEGDETVQNRKIHALDLDKKFDDCIITRDKYTEVEQLLEDYGHVTHIGNSESSDVEPFDGMENVTVLYIPQEEWRDSDLEEHSENVSVLNSIREIQENHLSP